MRVAVGPDSPLPIVAATDWPAVVVLGAYQTGVVAVRALRRRGVRTILLDCDSRQPGFRSTHGRAELCPNPDTTPEQWVVFMRDLARRIGGRPPVLASADQFVSAIARHADELRPHFRISGSAELQGALAEKHSQYALAALHGMPMPLTRQVSTPGEVVAYAASASFPCVLKPLHFREWQRFPPDHVLAHQKLAVAHDATELQEAYALAAPVNPIVVLQEIVQGPDTNKRVYLAHYGEDGTRTGHALFRAFRCEPVGFGPATVTEPVTDEESDATCDAFLRRIGFRGICEIEVKRDARDGRVKLIEANPRLSGGGDAGRYVGVDLGWLHYLALLGVPHAPVSPLARDFRHVVLRADAYAAVRYLRAGLIGWRDLIRSYRPPLAFFDLDLRDPGYSVRTLASAGRTILRESFRRRDPAHALAARNAGIAITSG